MTRDTPASDAPDPQSSPVPSAGRRGEVLAWAGYDWANSAYSTLAITLLVAYIQTVVFPKESHGTLGAQIWAFGIASSMLLAAILSPIVGAIADAHASKRRWLATTAGLGAGSAMLLSLVPPQYGWLIVALFFSTSLCFELSLGVYNGFLPEIADSESMNRISAWGYSLGYVGGGLALVGAILLMQFGPSIGLPDEVAQLRAGLFLMGAWWGVFTIPTIVVLRDRCQPSRQPAPLAIAVRHAVVEVGHTLRHLRSFGMLALFLLGFLFYNDGIQTVISQSSTFALEELSFTTSQLIQLILMVQFVAMPGAMGVSWIADRWGQKPTLMACLAIWIGLLVVAYNIQTQGQFWIMAVVLALVMGGTQSVSRAIMGQMTPQRHAAEFFGFFNLSGKATSFFGTFLFGVMIRWTGSARLAILSLLVFFLLGTLLVVWVDVERGRREAGNDARASQ
ncbi:MAG: MFS transporter [Pirellulales bacterium]